MYYLSLLYIILICSLLPIHMADGYYELGEAKGFCYMIVSLVFFVLLVLLGAVRYVRKDLHITKKRSATEFFLYAYLFSAVMSLIYSVDKTTAFLGVEGWRNGFVTCLFCVFFAIVYSYYYQSNLLVVLLMLLVPMGEFLLCILGRMGIYPIDFYGQAPGFVATIGNINWYSGFLSVFVPIGVGIMYIKKPFSTYFFLSGIYTLLGLVALLMQGSDGAALILVATYTLLLACSLGKRESFRAFLVQLGVLGIAMTIVDVLMLFWGSSYTYDSNILIQCCEMHVGGILLAAVFFVYRISRLFEEISVSWYRKLYSVFLAVFVVGGLGAAATYIVLNFSDSFGNGRGIIWRMSLEMFMGLSPWQKAVGVGQDCFYSYAMNSPVWAESFRNVFGNYRLTNAHCELLTIMVERGLLGTFVHLGLFVAAIAELIKAQEKESIAIVYALPIISYFAFNLVSFAQPTSTPYVFICLGFAVATIRGIREEGERQ